MQLSLSSRFSLEIGVLTTMLESIDPKSTTAASRRKSSSAQPGAIQLAALAKEIDSRARTGSVDGARELRDELLIELEAVNEQAGYGAIRSTR